MVKVHAVDSRWAMRFHLGTRSGLDALQVGIQVGEDPPHVRAKEEMAALEAQRLFEKGYVKEYYFRFSEILRRYLEVIRGFPAAEFTTQEIALYLDREQDRKLLPLLRHADLVKFAEALPTQAQKEEEVEKALSYIRETSPVQGTENSSNNTRGITR